MNNIIYNKNQLILIVIVGVLLISNIYFAMRSHNLSKELEVSNASVSAIQKNEKIIDFTQLFIEKVLNADTEVDFTTRLQLENAVRDLKDDEVLSGWQKFIESKTDNEAADSVKDLLMVLIKKAN